MDWIIIKVKCQSCSSELNNLELKELTGGQRGDKTVKYASYTHDNSSETEKYH